MRNPNFNSGLNIELPSLAQFGEQVAKQAEEFSRQVAAFRTTVAGPFQRLEDLLRVTVLSFEREAERWATTMLRLGWPPPLEVPVSLMSDLYESGHATEAEVAELFVEFYDVDELEPMVET